MNFAGKVNEMRLTLMPTNNQATSERKPKVAILDDYAGAALNLVDWSAVRNRADVTVFNQHLSEDEAVEALQMYDGVCTFRERMALPRSLIERLPNLKLITIVRLSDATGGFGRRR